MKIKTEIKWNSFPLKKIQKHKTQTFLIKWIIKIRQSWNSKTKIVSQSRSYQQSQTPLTHTHTHEHSHTHTPSVLVAQRRTLFYRQRLWTAILGLADHSISALSDWLLASVHVNRVWVLKPPLEGFGSSGHSSRRAQRSQNRFRGLNGRRHAVTLSCYFGPQNLYNVCLTSKKAGKWLSATVPGKNILLSTETLWMSA